MEGVTWAMGEPPRQQIIAVLGHDVITRSAKSVWRSGMYMDSGKAQEQATRMTSDLEGEGLWLTAGPAVFEVDVPTGTGTLTQEVKEAICAVLRITDPHTPDLDTGTHSAILEYTRTVIDDMKRDFGL